MEDQRTRRPVDDAADGAGDLSAGEFTQEALGYFASHGIDPEIAGSLGVGEEDGALLYPFTDGDGDYLRRRPLDGDRTYQPKGRSLTPWAPFGIDGAILFTEGESDFLAAASVLYRVLDLEGEGAVLDHRRDLPPALARVIPVALPGVGSCHRQAAEIVAEGDCVIAFDGDNAGRLGAEKLRAAIADSDREQGLGPAAVATLPDGLDLSDVLAGADDPTGALADLVAEAEAAAEVPVDGDVDGEEAAAEGEGKRPTQSQVILELALEAGLECWATPEGDTYMTACVGDHREHHRLGSRASRDYLSKLFFDREDKAPSAQALQDSLGVLRGQAQWGDGERVEVHVRHAAHGGKIYIDLGDDDWRAVEIDAEGWRVLSDPPVRFRRPRGMLPLPEPEQRGSLDALRRLLNVDDDGWKLTAGYMVGCLAPSGPYPILSFLGEQGSAKSSAARNVRSLIDPNVAPLRSEPRDERDLVIAASNGRIIALDNVSRLSPALSDGLCRLSTGGGYGTRELYSDGDEILFSETRPAVITSIGEVATRGDLLDRSILVTLEPISESARLTEAELLDRWEEMAPGAFGALLDAASTALRRLDGVRLERLPRMADHARWVTAAEPALGWKRGTYLKVYGEARAAAVETALDSSPLSEPIRTLAATGWEGSATDLLEALGAEVGEGATRSRSWPKSARGLSSALRRLAPDLRAEGIGVEWSREGHERRRTISIERIGELASAPSSSSASALQSGSSAVAGADANEAADANGDLADARQIALRPRENGSAKPNSATADGADAKRLTHSGCTSHSEPVDSCRYCTAMIEGAA